MDKSSLANMNRMIEKSIEQAEKNLTGQKAVISVRLSQEEIEVIDQLVFLELAKNRSDATGMLIREGIRANQALLDQIQGYTVQLEQIKAKIKESIQNSGLVTLLNADTAGDSEAEGVNRNEQEKSE